jgi:hypothetical protein
MLELNTHVFTLEFVRTPDPTEPCISTPEFARVLGLRLFCLLFRLTHDFGFGT